MNYERVSHTHCWNQQPSACGIPLAEHTQCCLCDLTVPMNTYIEGQKQLFRNLDDHDKFQAADNNFLTHSLQEAYLKGIEDAEGVVPRSENEEVKSTHTEVWKMGWNEHHTETLSALSALKENITPF